jgi:hypothetical protein
MCCCNEPNVNGTMGYQWQPTHAPMVRPVDPPTVEETDVLLFDEPGRCGGLDSHCHHYRVVERHGSRLLLVRNGGGDTSIRLSGPVSIPLLSLDSNGRYWLLNAIFHAQADGAMGAYARERAVWKQAAAEKRIRTRKQRGGNGVKVWIEDKAGA